MDKNRQKQFLAIIEKALDILKERHRWTSEAYARTNDGRACAPLNPGAEKWDLMGAVVKASHELRIEKGSVMALDTLKGGRHPILVNDEDGYEAVVDTLNRLKGELN